MGDRVASVSRLSENMIKIPQMNNIKLTEINFRNHNRFETPPTQIIITKSQQQRFQNELQDFQIQEQIIHKNAQYKMLEDQSIVRPTKEDTGQSKDWEDFSEISASSLKESNQNEQRNSNSMQTYKHQNDQILHRYSQNLKQSDAKFYQQELDDEVQLRSFIEDNEAMINQEQQKMIVLKCQKQQQQPNTYQESLQNLQQQSKNFQNQQKQDFQCSPNQVNQSVNINDDRMYRSKQIQPLIQETQNRLYQNGLLQMRRRSQYNGQPDKECSFAPQINKNTDLLIQKRQKRNSPLQREQSPNQSQYRNGSTKTSQERQSFKPLNGNNYSRLTEMSSKKHNKNLVQNMVKRQVKQVLSYVKNEVQSFQGFTKSMMHDIFYLLGTFQNLLGCYDMLQQNREQRDNRFLDELWGLLEINQLNNLKLPDDYTFQLLLIFYNTHDKNLALEQLIQLIPEIRIHNLDQSCNVQNYALTGITLDPQELLSQVKFILRQFEDLNHGQFGKICDFRLKDYLKQSSNEKSKKEVDEEINCTFTPNINLKSIEMDHRRSIVNHRYSQSVIQNYNTNGGVSQREKSNDPRQSVDHSKNQIKREEILQQYGKIVQEKIQMKKAMREQQEMNTLTFKPQITNKSREIAASSNYSVSILRCLKLSQQFDKRNSSKDYKRHHSPAVQRYLETKDKDLTFKPQINKNYQTKLKKSGSVSSFKGSVKRERKDQQFQTSNHNQSQNSSLRESFNLNCHDQQVSHNISQISTGRGGPSLIEREIEKKKDLFVLSVTLSNKKQYHVKVQKNCNPSKVADLFCYEHGLADEVKYELRELLFQSMQQFDNVKQ
eukprot:403359905